MDPRTFDTLTRRVATSRSRRALLRLVAGVLSGGLVVGGAARASAQPCGVAGESCETQGCCEGLVCSADLACVAAAPVATCGFELEPCENQPCCEGLVCSVDLACVFPEPVATCGFAGESCENQGCCEGLECTADLACAYPLAEAPCGFEGESCENRPCCAGFGCTADLACVALDEQQQCGYEGQSCENRPCCAGLGCTADLACVIPDPARHCGYIQQSCETQPCCAGLVCTGDLRCIAPDPAVHCGYLGQSCENQPCCAGLACGVDLACVVAEVTPAAGQPGPATPAAQPARADRQAARHRQRDASSGNGKGSKSRPAVEAGQSGTTANRGQKQRHAAASGGTRQRLSAAALGLPEALVTLTAEGLQSPPALAAGRYLLTVVNETDAAALVQLVGVPQGWTRDRVAAGLAAMRSDDPVPDAVAWMAEAAFAGGGAAPGGGAAQAVVDLPPGQWAVADLVSAALGGLQVTGALPDDLPRVKATATVSARETGAGFATAVDGAVVAGPQLVRVRNQTGHPALLVPFRTERALTDAAFLETMAGLPRSAIFGAGTPLPAGVRVAPASGLVSKGSAFWWRVDLAPGAYTLAWVLPDRGVTPLLAAGLIASVEVAAG